MNEDLLNVFGSFSEISLDCIEKQNEEIEQLKRNCNIGNENLKFYKQENQQLKDRIEKANILIKKIKDDIYEKMAECYENEDNWNGDFLNIEINSIDRLLKILK